MKLPFPNSSGIVWGRSLKLASYADALYAHHIIPPPPHKHAIFISEGDDLEANSCSSKFAHLTLVINKVNNELFVVSYRLNLLTQVMYMMMFMSQKTGTTFKGVCSAVSFFSSDKRANIQTVRFTNLLRQLIHLYQPQVDK